MRILGLIGDLGCGGAQRVFSRLVAEWLHAGLVVSVGLVGAPRQSFFPVPPQVPVFRTLGQRAGRPRFPVSVALAARQSSPLAASVVNFSGYAINVVALSRLYRFERPDVVVAFMPSAALPALSVSGPRPPVVVASRVWSEFGPGAPAHHRILYRKLYNRAAALVVLNSRMAQWYRERLYCPIRIVPNGFPSFPSYAVAPPSSLQGSVLLAVGRLHYQKGFDILLHAFAILAPAKPDWRLLLVGEGSELGALKALAHDLGISSRVRFAGSDPAIWRYYRSADLYVLPSRFEGCPNALREAMAAGLPVVAVDCPTGPREIIRHGVDGILVPSCRPAPLASALSLLMDNPFLRTRLGAAAAAAAHRRPWSVVSMEWLSVLRCAVQPRRT